MNFWADQVAWKRAAKNTLNCLIGCNIGDFGTIIYMQTYYPRAPMFWVMTLAILMGLLTSVLFETIMLKVKEGFAWIAGLRMAFSMSFLSMLGMEIAENTTDYFLTGGTVTPSEPYYWGALSISLVVGFLAPLPYNYYKFKKHGHACCHE